MYFPYRNVGVDRTEGKYSFIGCFFLLYDLQRSLNVMEFRQGTVWYRINACVNRKGDMSGTVKVDYPVVDASRSFRSHTSYKHAA